MKVAVYTIALNESKHVDRFMDSVGEADQVYVADTGSTDDTVAKLEARGAVVASICVSPWRFDDARNAGLHLVPADVDVCLSVDLDEVLTKGWRRELERAWVNGINRLRYKYVWGPGVTFYYEKCHARSGFRWVKPVHEILHADVPEVWGVTEGFTLYHHPDPTKSRGSYLSLLELGCREEPDDDRNCHYLGREYMYYGLYDKAVAELKRHLGLPRATWRSERAASMRYLGRCYGLLNQPQEATRWFRMAVAECPDDREPWVELGKHLYDLRDHLGCYHAMTTALAIQARPYSYISDPLAWGSVPYDLGGVSAWYVGLRERSVELITKARELDPSDARIKSNLELVTR